MNRALTTAAIGIGAAQAIKIPLTYVLSKKWIVLNWYKLAECQAHIQVV